MTINSRTIDQAGPIELIETEVSTPAYVKLSDGRIRYNGDTSALRFDVWCDTCDRFVGAPSDKDKATETFKEHQGVHEATT